MPNPADTWQNVFPVLDRDHGTDECAVMDGQRYLDGAWLGRCLGITIPAKGQVGSFSGPLDKLLAQLQRANQIFFENGYVDSGIRYKAEGEDPEHPSAHLDVIRGTLVGSDGDECSLPWASSAHSRFTRHYVRKRLMRGCRKGRAFNVYLLSRDFARLADDRDPWIRRLNLNVVPCTIGVATLSSAQQPFRDGTSPCPRSADWKEPPDHPARVEPVDVVRKTVRTATIGFANDRSPSIGSFRGFANVGLRLVPGTSLDLEGGATNGALDGSGDLAVTLTPRLTFVAAGQYNSAEVVDPILRPLGIKSRSWGGDASIYYGAVQCPITRVYGDPLAAQARRPAAGSPFSECRLAVRLPGDGPKGWSAGRDLTFGLTLSHTDARTYLLGQPFSFSPGSVDGRAYVTALRGSIDWLERGRTGRDGERGWTLAARLITSVGLDGSASDIAGLDNPSPHFVVVRGQLGFAWQLGLAHLTFDSRLSGQWTRRPLYTTERFSIGGVNSVRGYPESALLADRALVGSVGLDRNFSLSGRTRPEDSTSQDSSRFRLSVFSDAAVATTLDPLSRSTDWLGSIGGGIAWVPSSAAEFSFEYGRRLGRSHSGPDHSLADQGIHIAVTLQPLRLWCLLQGKSSSGCLDT